MVSVSNEKYREYIKQMVDCIDDERDLKQIYTIVHRKFIKRTGTQEEIAPAQNER